MQIISILAGGVALLGFNVAAKFALLRQNVKDHGTIVLADGRNTGQREYRLFEQSSCVALLEERSFVYMNTGKYEHTLRTLVPLGSVIAQTVHVEEKGSDKNARGWCLVASARDQLRREITIETPTTKDKKLETFVDQIRICFSDNAAATKAGSAVRELASHCGAEKGSTQ